jgi:hypothetical protein
MLPLWCDAEGGVRVSRPDGPGEAEPLVRLFERVAGEEGWRPGGALRLWPDRSVYFALEAGGRLAGGLQLVRADPQGRLPCHALWPEAGVGPPGRSAHVAVLALDREARGRSDLFWSLAVETWRYCVGEGIAALSLEVTPRVLPIYRRLGWPLEVRGGPRPHWGEDCYLCALGIPEVAQTLLKRTESSPYYRRIVAQAFRMDLPARGREGGGVTPTALCPSVPSEGGDGKR